ncbi:YphA family membrane protein [Chengkuizengella axinellae]
MNPGYLSFLLLSITYILVFFGWENQIIQEVSRKTILVFMLVWSLFLFIDIPLFNTYVNLSYLIMLLTSTYIYLSQKTRFISFHSLTFMIFFSTLYVLFQQLYFMDPMFIIYHPTVDAAIVLAMLTAVLVKSSLEQFAVITIGIILGDFILSYFTLYHLPTQLGTFELYDIWMLTFIICRFISETVSKAYQTFKQYFIKIRS